MSREWRPGDVAMVTFGFGEKRRAMRDAGGTGWGIVDEVDSLQVQDARPLVVLDPEDRDQVKDLCRRYVESYGGKWDGRHQPVDDMQAALRSLVAPPKPEEPTDPKARVSDRRENIWRLLADGDWVCTSGPDIGEYIAWRGLMERGPLTVQVIP